MHLYYILFLFLGHLVPFFETMQHSFFIYKLFVSYQKPIKKRRKRIENNCKFLNQVRERSTSGNFPTLSTNLPIISFAQVIKNEGIGSPCLNPLTTPNIPQGVPFNMTICKWISSQEHE